MNQVSLVIGADIVPTNININFFESGNVESLIGKKILNALQNADLRIFNLECPLTDIESPISKCGSHQYNNQQESLFRRVDLDSCGRFWSIRSDGL